MMKDRSGGGCLCRVEGSGDGASGVGSRAVVTRDVWHHKSGSAMMGLHRMRKMEEEEIKERPRRARFELLYLDSTVNDD